MKRILFVCTGNTCRSPMAEHIARRLLEEKGLRGEIEVASAGLAALPGAPASAEARDVLRGMGIDLSGHQAVQLSRKQVEDADLIFTMTASQKRQLLELYPEARGKVFVLKEYGAKGRDSLQDSRLVDLLRRVEEKRIRFQAAYGKQISRLEQERAEILRRLQEIEDELASWQDLLKRELQPEMDELRRLEQEMSDYDIPDPFGKPRDAYEECASELARAIEAALRRLVEDN
ncbi:MAG: low molecular weight protein arginine phosphatase [Thermacetogeniaceae bacterium]